jgi:hypothetical protein
MALDRKNWSLDRIDSSLGYIEGNVQWIYKEIQFMKRVLSQEDFIGWCEKIALHRQEKIPNENGIREEGNNE